MDPIRPGPDRDWRRLLENPIRRAILLSLAGGERDLRDLCHHLSGTPLDRVHYHASRLRGAGLAARRRAGKAALFRITPEGRRALGCIEDEA